MADMSASPAGFRCHLVSMATQKYVCAEGGGGRELTAARDECNEWETFTIHNTSAGIAIQVYDSRFLHAVGGGGGALVADQVGGGCTFKLENAGGGAKRSQLFCAAHRRFIHTALMQCAALRAPSCLLLNVLANILFFKMISQSSLLRLRQGEKQNNCIGYV